MEPRNQSDTLQKLLLRDPLRRAALEAVASLDLQDCWIGAGFVRDAAWDYLPNYRMTPPSGDVDVIWFDPTRWHKDVDRYFECELQRRLPNLAWSVKNQARMHMRNGVAPYASVSNAISNWPETATAVATRLDPSGTVQINALLGLHDLFSFTAAADANVYDK